ncbi:unnamed protein product [Clavelina lepadiformis]|uniref:Uncharacterized protein n=1 Tax=Clavelina lepadiformis TaxID=159417 RepID=A0ABP0G0S9_CLALP
MKVMKVLKVLTGLKSYEGPKRQTFHWSEKLPCELYGGKCLIHIEQSSSGSQNVYQSLINSDTHFETR